MEQSLGSHAPFADLDSQASGSKSFETAQLVRSNVGSLESQHLESRRRWIPHVVESIRRDTKRNRSSTTPVPADGAEGREMI